MSRNKRAISRTAQRAPVAMLVLMVHAAVVIAVWLLLANVGLCGERGGVYHVIASSMQVGVEEHGSAVALDVESPYLFFLSTNHTAPTGTASIMVDGQSYPAQVVERIPAEPEPLIVLRSLDQHPRVPIRTYPVAVKPAVPGERVFVLGFPGGGDFSGYSARIRRVELAHGGYLVIDRPARQGVSGGPVLNAAGEIVGIMTHTGQTYSLASNVPGNLSQFTGRQVSFQCYGGSCRISPARPYQYGYAAPQYSLPAPKKPSRVSPPVAQVPAAGCPGTCAAECQCGCDPGRKVETPNELARGPAGKDGRDGKDGINGKDGRDGKDGINGKDGQPGKDATAFFHVILRKDGEEVDRQTIGNGETLILDLETLTNRGPSQ